MANMDNNISTQIDNFTVASAHHCDTDACNEIMKNSKSSLKIITQNIRSVYKNLDSFQAQLARLSYEIDIIILTECWLNADKPIPTMENYVTYSSKKCLNQNDGIVIFVKRNLQCSVEEPDPAGANFLLLKIDSDTCILASYRSPSLYCIDSFLNSLENILSKLKGNNIMLVGDINIDIKPNNSDRNSSSYLNLTAEMGLLPGHAFPTRLRNCLDHIMIRTTTCATVIVMDSTVSDHASVMVCLGSAPSKNKNHKKITKVNYESAVEQLKTTDFTYITQNCNANEAATRFVECLISTVSQHSTVAKAPNRKVLLKPWITPGLLRCVRHRDNLHRKSLADPKNGIVEVTYKRYRNHCNLLLRKLRNAHESSALKSAKDNKETWNIIKSITHQTGKQNSADKLLPATGIADAPDAIEQINHYFSNIGKLLADNILKKQNSSLPPYVIETPPARDSLVLLPPDEAEVEAVINNLKNDCATGWDSIPAKLLKLGKEVLVPPITKLIEACFEQGVFPRIFKKSLVTPVHKGGNQDDVKNFRPISVLSTLSKILEKLLNRRLMKYLEHNKIISDTQFGFRPGKSTADAVNQLVDYVTGKLDAKQKCLGVFLDLAKAFDTVRIPTLVTKLEHAGIRGRALDIFTDFLNDRTQKVKIGEVISNEARVDYGVPQGSCLSPSLFLLYVNDLCQQSLNNGKIFSYADDTVLIFHGEHWDTAREAAETGLRKIIHWLEGNLLTLNISKTSFLQFTFAKTKPTVVSLKAHSCDVANSGIPCSCLPITQQKTMKYLGVILDEGLTWRPHIEQTSSRVRKLIWAFKKLRQVAEFKLLRAIYLALAQSIVGYCITAWGGACKTHMIRLERAQRSLLKVMTFKPYRFPTRTLYESCQVLTVRQLYLLNLILKQHEKTPVNHATKHTRTFRNVCSTVKCKTASARRQRLYLSSYLYNKINNILNLNPLTKNKTKIKLNSWLQTLDYQQTENLIKEQYSR